MPTTKQHSTTRNGKDFHPPSSSSSSVSEQITHSSKCTYRDVATTPRSNPFSILASSPSATQPSIPTQESIPLSQVILHASQQKQVDDDPIIHAPNVPKHNSCLSIDHDHVPSVPVVDSTPPSMLDNQINSLFELICLQQHQIKNNDQAHALRLQKITDSTDWIAKSVKTQNKAIIQIMHSNQCPVPPTTSHPSVHKVVSNTTPPQFDEYSINDETNPTNDNNTDTAHIEDVPIQQKHPHLKNPPHISTHNSQPSSNSLFNNNEFLIACSGKIKFSAIESALQKRTLDNDSIQKMELFYSGLI
jgi:hypothetical protein